ncbi:MAG: NUDIX hydrolase [Deltaproteobacteria bacterium]|nr:NUDIX hydrolase [Deltaproteobacteria bacterium]
MTLLPFVEVEEGPLERKRIFSFRQDRVKSGLSGRETRVDRILAPDWVNVVAFDDDDNLLLVRQWRFGINEFSVEIPAGAIDHGEDPVVGGLRELAEETGHTPVDDAAVVLLGATRPNAAFMNNRCFTIFVPRARKTREQALDPTEEVEVLKVPRAEIDDRVTAGSRRCADRQTKTATDALMDNSLVLVALHLWKLHTGA